MDGTLKADSQEDAACRGTADALGLVQAVGPLFYAIPKETRDLLIKASHVRLDQLREQPDPLHRDVLAVAGILLEIAKLRSAPGGSLARVKLGLVALGFLASVDVESRCGATREAAISVVCRRTEFLAALNRAAKALGTNFATEVQAPRSVEAASLPECVTLSQAAAIVGRKRDALRKYKGRGLPAPAVPHKKLGQPDQYAWPEMRAFLEDTFRDGLPEHFPRL